MTTFIRSILQMSLLLNNRNENEQNDIRQNIWEKL